MNITMRYSVNLNIFKLTYKLDYANDTVIVHNIIIHSFNVEIFVKIKNILF